MAFSNQVDLSGYMNMAKANIKEHGTVSARVYSSGTSKAGETYRNTIGNGSGKAVKNNTNYKKKDPTYTPSGRLAYKKNPIKGSEKMYKERD